MVQKKNMLKIWVVDQAWKIWNISCKLNDLIWDRYEDQLLELHLKQEAKQYWEKAAEEYQDTIEPRF